MVNWKKVCTNKRFLLLILLVVLQCVIFQKRIYGYMQVTGEKLIPSVGDYFFEFYKGVTPYQNENVKSAFRIPGIWSAYYIYLHYMIGMTIHQFLHDSQQWVVRWGSRRRSWRQLCKRVIIESMMYYLVTDILLLTFCLCNQVQLEYPHQELQNKINGVDISEISGIEVGCMMLIIPVLITCVLACIQVVVSLLSNTIFGIVCIVCTLVCSVFGDFPLIIGKYLMAIRNVSYLNNGYKIAYIVVFCMVIRLLCDGIGKRIIEKTDFGL